MMRRVGSSLVSAVSVVLLLVSAAMGQVSVGDPMYGGNVSAIMSGDGTLTISGTGRMKDFVSPSEFGQRTPWSIERITRVVVNEGVTYIGSHAFNGAANLRSVTLPNSLAGIGHSTFANCGRLTSITLPNRLQFIGQYAFVRTGLTSITIPAGVTHIGFEAFDPTPITTVTFNGRMSAENIQIAQVTGGYPSSGPFAGDLHTKYLAGGPGTYIRYGNGNYPIWFTRAELTRHQAEEARQRLEYERRLERRLTEETGWQEAKNVTAQPASTVSQGNIKYVNSTTTGVLNLRVQPNAGAELLFAIPHGQAVNVLGSAGRDPWVRVTYNNMTGFVNSRFLSDTRP